MSPLLLRRYRAERLLREEFEALRGRVLASVSRRLQAVGVRLDEGDLEACYAQAWHGLYGTVLDGREVENPAGWLVVATFRRAIDEHRCSGESHEPPAGWDPPGAHGDLAAELDDRVRLRQLMEGLRGSLSAREREAAALCYLQGLSRAEAAARMGLSERRMRRLMEGRSPARPGVAVKVGALVETIRHGGWCEQQGSLMRALAFGVLDPGGERYSLAAQHRSECPACRAYVLSLRGLAAALPPSFWPLGPGAAILSHACAAAHAGSAAAAGKGVGAGAAGAGGTAGTAAGAGVAGGAGSGGALAGGAGGVLIGGPLGAKLALGCLLALGVGVGCIAVQDGRGPAARVPARQARLAAVTHHALTVTAPQPEASGAVGRSATAAPHAPVVTEAGGGAAREFSPEAGAPAQVAVPLASSRPTARAASAEFSSAPAASAVAPGGGAAGPATREFSPG
jgi:DNA-directed RNA polymerase specialized sigma24 family protein